MICWDTEEASKGENLGILFGGSRSETPSLSHSKGVSYRKALLQAEESV